MPFVTITFVIWVNFWGSEFGHFLKKWVEKKEKNIFIFLFKKIKVIVTNSAEKLFRILENNLYSKRGCLYRI